MLKKISFKLKEIDEDEDKIYYLKKQFYQKYDKIEDTEHEIEKNEQKFKEAMKDLASKEKKLNHLENLITENVMMTRK